MTAPAVKAQAYPVQFWLLCFSSLLFFSSFMMVIPELPAYLSGLGGGEYKGLIISLFTITAMLSRPFSGRLADKIGRVPVMMVGSAVCVVCSATYPILASVAGFMILRLVHGFSTGFTPTGQTAYLSDIVPARKRGEAMGYLGTAGTLGMAGGPAIGAAVANHISMEAMFYCSSLFALSSLLILGGIKETLKQKVRFSPSLLKVGKEDIFEPRVLVPCLVMVLSTYSFGAVFTLIPDLGEFVGIRNKGLLFTYFTLASLLVRLLGGKASDFYGRPVVLKISTAMVTLAMVIIGMAQEAYTLILGISLYGVAHGITAPTLLAWASDLSDEQHKGRGLASLYIFMELGIGLGAFFSGWIYANNFTHFTIAFLTCASLSGVAFIYLMTGRLPITSHGVR